MKKIAVVEDNPDNLMLIEAILGGEFELLTFENGIDALTGLPGSGVDIMLIDIALPEMDGVALLNQLKKIDDLAKTPAIALTAHAMVGDREKYLNEGFDGYFSKPILDMDEFKTLIRTFLP